MVLGHQQDNQQQHTAGWEQAYLLPSPQQQLQHHQQHNQAALQALQHQQQGGMQMVGARYGAVGDGAASDEDGKDDSDSEDDAYSSEEEDQSVSSSRRRKRVSSSRVHLVPAVSGSHCGAVTLAGFEHCLRRRTQHMTSIFMTDRVRVASAIDAQVVAASPHSHSRCLCIWLVLGSQLA